MLGSKDPPHGAFLHSRHPRMDVDCDMDRLEDAFDAASLVSRLQEDLFGTLRSARTALFVGVLGWVICAPLLLAAVYAIALPAMRRMIGKARRE